MQQQYSFVTKWQIKAPIQAVWDAIYHSEEWPEWWKGVISVEEIRKNDSNGVNGIKYYTWKSVLPYTLKFNMQLLKCHQPKYLYGKAFGELQGEGTWLLEQKKDVTYVQYNWNVHTNKAWMNFFSFLLKPVFKYNHDVVMRWGAKGLSKRLNATLISY